MKSKLQLVQVAEAEEPRGVQMPDDAQLSLAGIAGQAKDGVLALAVSTGLVVLHETMEWEVDRIAGSKEPQDRRCCFGSPQLWSRSHDAGATIQKSGRRDGGSP